MFSIFRYVSADSFNLWDECPKQFFFLNFGYTFPYPPTLIYHENDIS